MTTGDNLTAGGEAKAPPSPLRNGEPDERMDTDDAPPAIDGVAAEDDVYKPEATLRLELRNFADFVKGNEQRLSAPVHVRGLPWKVLAMPREATRLSAVANRSKSLGFFLQCNADSESPSWTCNAQAVLKVLAQKDGAANHERRITHTFYPKENDWGYSQFMAFDQLLDVENGYYKDDTIILEVSVNADAPHGVAWDSKKHTGFIGLKNQGATCYMNSLLQTLFFTNRLRRAVYQIPTEKDDPQNSVVLAMQRVFFELQFSDKPVGTKKLTRSFGWDTYESFLQHDVQELCRVLLDNLESKMKGTTVERTLADLFEGKMKSYIRCKDVDFESSRDEAFYDIQLNIKGKGSIYESFKDYVRVETLDGDNKYDAGDLGMQDAEKGIKFVKFPPVLHLQLMRFQYDPVQDANVKINDRCEFSSAIDLSIYEEGGATADDKAYYLLHSVLVHALAPMSRSAGHYVAFVSPQCDGKWCKFDDDVVSRATTREAVQANFGGDDPDVPQRAYTNAYMLVYIRQSCMSDVLQPVTESSIASHLRDRFEAEKRQDQLRKKEKSEAHLYTNVALVGEEVFVSHRGFDLMDLDIADATARRFRVAKKASVDEFYQQVGESFGLKPQTQFRLWSMRETGGRMKPSFLAVQEPVNRNAPSSQRRPVRIQDVLYDDKSWVFMEMHDIASGQPLPQFDDVEDILIFLKYYDPRHKLVSYVGHMIVSLSCPLRKLFADMCRRAQISNRADLQLFEEVAPSRFEPITVFDRPIGGDDRGASKILHDMTDGVIIVYQQPACSLDAQLEFPTARDYFVDLYNRIEVEAVERDVDGAAPVTGAMSQLRPVRELLEWLGKEIGYDSNKIQLFRPSPYHAERPGANLQSSGDLPLRSVLSTAAGRLDRRDRHYRLYYQKMPIRIDEMDKRKPIKLLWMDSKQKTDEITVYPDKTGTVKTILDEVQKQVQLSDGGTGKLRLVWVGSTLGPQRCYQVLPLETTVEAVATTKTTGQSAVRAEEVPADQLNVELGKEYLLPVAHFHKDPIHTFGSPFFIKVHQGELFSKVRERIKEMVQVSEKEFEKFKFALVTNQSKPKFLDDLESCSVNLNDLNTSLAGHISQPWLGLEHVNKYRGGRAGHPLEKAIVIHN